MNTIGSVSPAALELPAAAAARWRGCVRGTGRRLLATPSRIPARHLMAPSAPPPGRRAARGARQPREDGLPTGGVPRVAATARPPWSPPAVKTRRMPARPERRPGPGQRAESSVRSRSRCRRSPPCCWQRRTTASCPCHWRALRPRAAAPPQLTAHAHAGHTRGSHTRVAHAGAGGGITEPAQLRPTPEIIGKSQPVCGCRYHGTRTATAHARNHR
jgi:hypothetical protein